MESVENNESETDSYNMAIWEIAIDTPISPDVVDLGKLYYGNEGMMCAIDKKSQDRDRQI
ncbi:hypothetical protein [Chamaesiphon sp. GL140_3_metabinner_50]|uniref:hypothetical protein n=1 Tax=Chamaesiphon sp. GL140_3_metabinner_50 TaxID=2970812 RepID=UPI0025D8DAFA|nr:hypothetical protein [Chamaesiphon sp. GL140_3_metabinner_50]